LRRVERLAGQRAQQRPLPGRGHAHGLGPGRDPARVVAGVRRGQRLVQRGQRPQVRHRGQVPAAEPADLALHPALLVRALDAGPAVERVEPVVRAQRDEPLVLEPLAPQHHPDHRGPQVVVADHPGRHPAQRGERPHVPVQKRLLRLVGVGHVHRLARVRQPQHEQVQAHHHPADRGAELTEVHLGLSARRMPLRHHHLPPVQPHLGLELPDQRPDAGLGHRDALLLDQPLPHPARGVSLLARRVQILGQPPAHGPHMRAEDRRDPLRGPARGRHRVHQRLTHRPPVHPVPGRQRPDRQALPGIASDTFELLHSRSLLHPYASVIALADVTERRNRWVEGGAKSGHH
jgi:hypothetical protein